MSQGALMRKLTFIITGCLLVITGCANQSPVQNAYPSQTSVIGTGAVGAMTGAAIGSGSGAGGATLGAVAGGAAGVGYGLYKNSKPGLADSLAYQGVQSIQVGDTLRVIIYSDKCFYNNEPRINEACYPALTNVAALFKAYGNIPIKVTGYMDNVYDAKSARFISQQQADAIVAFLWTRGIPATRFRVVGLGLIDPVASNRNVSASSANRRIELTLDQHFDNAPTPQPLAADASTCDTNPVAAWCATAKAKRVVHHHKKTVKHHYQKKKVNNYNYKKQPCVSSDESNVTGCDGNAD